MAKRIQIVPKNIAFPEAIVFDDSEKYMKELYKEADAKTSEKYGKNSQAYKTITNGINIKDVKGSQFFWNTNLGMYLPENQRVISLSDMEEINNLDEGFFGGFYTDSPQIVLRTSTPSWKNNKYILENLVKQVKKQGFDFSPENPLVISNLELARSKNSNNSYGIFLRIGENTKLENDTRFSNLNDGKKVDFGDKQKTICTKKDGLSRVYLNWDDNLNSRNDNLAYSNGNGRVVVRDAEGVAPQNTYVGKMIKDKKSKLEALEKEYLKKVKSI